MFQSDSILKEINGSAAVSSAADKQSKEEKSIQDEEEFMGYTISKQFLLEAWSKFRPSSYGNTPTRLNIDHRSNKEKSRKERLDAIYKQKDYAQIYGEAFITKLLAGIKMKAYNDKLRENQRERKTQIKTNKLVENFTHKL